MHIASAVLVLFLFFNLFLHRLLLHFVDVCARVSPFFSHPLCLSLLILFGLPPPSFPFFPSFSLPVCVCSLPVCVNPPPSVNLHVSSLLLLIILALLHPPFPRLNLRVRPRPVRHFRRRRPHQRRGPYTHIVDPPLNHLLSFP